MKNVSKIVKFIVVLSLGTVVISSCTSKRNNGKSDITITYPPTIEQIEITTTETANKIASSTRFPNGKFPDMPDIEEQVLLGNEMIKIYM